MKTLNILLVSAFVLSTASVFARIGETREQIDKRYGQGNPSDYQRLDGAETIKYHFNNFQVEVVFHEGKSIWEIYQRQGRLIDPRDIRILMKAKCHRRAHMALRWPEPPMEAFRKPAVHRLVLARPRRLFLHSGCESDRKRSEQRSWRSGRVLRGDRDSVTADHLANRKTARAA